MTIDADIDSSLILEDRHCSDTPTSYLIFEPITGSIILASDYEVVNDDKAREFAVDADDAIELAISLLSYAKRDR